MEAIVSSGLRTTCTKRKRPRSRRSHSLVYRTFSGALSAQRGFPALRAARSCSPTKARPDVQRLVLGHDGARGSREAEVGQGVVPEVP